MIFDVPTLVSYVSQFMTLLPGDVISTGTPAGVGLGMKPGAAVSEAGGCRRARHRWISAPARQRGVVPMRAQKMR